MGETAREISFNLLSRALDHQFFRLFNKNQIRPDSPGSPVDSGRLMASLCRQKIITTLARVNKTHMMDLIRKVNSTYTQVNRNLRILEQEGIIESQYCGRLRIIKLNKQNPRTEVILKALKMLRNPQLADRKKDWLFERQKEKRAQ